MGLILLLVVLVLQLRATFSAVSFYFFGERGERSPYHVWPIAPLGQDDPVPERNRDYPSDQPGISPAALCVRVHFDSGV